MTRTPKAPATPVPTATGQTRADRRGATIIVGATSPPARWFVEYPQLDGEIGVLSAVTIEQLYPIIVSEAR